MRVANIQALSPEVTAWRNNQYLHAGSWTATDSISQIDGSAVRTVKHYNTEMVEFVDYGDLNWWFGPLSTGHGSRSDQGGTAQLAKSVGSPMRLKCDAKGGGPRWVNTVLGCVVAHRDGCRI